MNDIFDNLKKIEEQIKQVHAKFGAIKKLPSYTQEFQDSTKELLKVADKLSRRLDAFRLRNAVVDMDGTLADLYGVDKWIDDLDNKRARPYEVAKPMMNIPKINKALREMNVVVATWLSKVTDETFDKAVIVAKKGWLKKYDFKYNSFAPMSYGTNKGDAVKKRKLLTKGLSLLIDDDPRVRDSWQLGPKIDPTKFDVSEVVTDYIKTFVTLQSSIDSIKTHMRKQIKEMRVVPKRPKTTGTSLYVDDDDDDDINKSYGFTSKRMNNNALYNRNAGKTLSNDLTSNPDKLIDAMYRLLQVHDKLIPVVNSYKEALQNSADPMEALAAGSFTKWDEELNNSKNSIIKMIDVLQRLTTTTAINYEAIKTHVLDDAANLSKMAQRIISRYGANNDYASTSEYDVIESTEVAIDQLNNSLLQMTNSTKRVSGIFDRMLFNNFENMSAPSEYGKSTISSSIPPFEDAVKNTDIFSTAGAQLELVMYDLIRSIRESEIAGSEWNTVYQKICDTLNNMGPLTQVAAQRMFKMSNYVGDTNVTPEDLSTPETKVEYIKLVAKAYMELYQRILALKHIIFTGATFKYLDMDSVNAQVDALRQNISELVTEGINLGNWRYLTEDVKNYADSIVSVIPAVEDLSKKIRIMSFATQFDRKSSAYGNLKTYIDPTAWQSMRKPIPDNIVQELIDDAILMGRNAGQGVAVGLDEMLDTIAGASGRAAAIIPYTFEDYLDIHSPSKVMELIGKFINEGLVKGLESNEELRSALNDILSEFKDAYITRMSKVLDDKQANAVSKNLIEIKNDVVKMSDVIYSASDGPEKLREALVSIYNARMVVDKGKLKTDEYKQAAKDVLRMKEALEEVVRAQFEVTLNTMRARGAEDKNVFMFSKNVDARTDISNLATLKASLSSMIREGTRTVKVATIWDVVRKAAEQLTTQISIMKTAFNTLPTDMQDTTTAHNTINSLVQDMETLLVSTGRLETSDNIQNFVEQLGQVTTKATLARVALENMNASTKRNPSELLGAVEQTNADTQKELQNAITAYNDAIAAAQKTIVDKAPTDIFMFDVNADTSTQVRNLQTLMSAMRNLMSFESKGSPMTNTWFVLNNLFKQAIMHLQIFKSNLNMQGNQDAPYVVEINENIRELLSTIDEIKTPEDLTNFGNSLLSLIGIIANVRADVQGMDDDFKNAFMQKISKLQARMGSSVGDAIKMDQDTIATNEAAKAQRDKNKADREAAKAQRDKDRETKKSTQSTQTHTDKLKHGAKATRNYAYGIRKIWWGLRRTMQFMNRMRSKLTHLTRVFNSINKVGNLFKSAFASVTGFYIGSELKDVIKYSVDYVEILELFRVATSGARIEAEKFVDVMEDIYGLDPNTIMQTAGTFFQLTSAINMPIAAAQKMSLGLTKVGVDIASLFNQQYEDVIQDLTSGMQGMTRAVRKYGIDIRVSTLQTLAAKIGMDGLVSEMSEADRQGLRYIQILDNVRAASGNFAKTIESVANQFKIAKEQSIGMFRAIGNLFMPMLKKYMYQINAYLMTFKTVFTYIGTLVGFKPEYFDPETENTEDGTKSVDEYGNAIDKVKSKLNRLAGFDELEILQNNAADDEDPMNLALQKAIEEYEVMMENFTMKAEAMRIELLKALGFTDSGDGTFDINFNFDTNEWDTTVQWLGDLGVTVQNIVTSMDGLGESFKGAFKKSWEAFKEFFQPITDIFKEMFGINSIHDVDEWFVNLKANLDNFSFDGFVQGLIDTIAEFGPKLLLAGIDMVLKILQGLVDGLNDNNNNKKLGEFVLDLGKNLGTHATDLVDGLLTLLSGMFEGMSDGLSNGTVKEDARTFTQNLLKSVTSNVPEIVAGALDLVKALSIGIISAVADPEVITNLLNAVIDIAETLISDLASIQNAGQTLLREFLNSLLDPDAESVLPKITHFVGKIIGFVIGSFVKAVTAIPFTLFEFFWKIFSAPKGQVMSVVKNMFSEIGESFKQFGTGFTEGFSEVLEPITDIINDVFKTDPAQNGGSSWEDDTNFTKSPFSKFWEDDYSTQPSGGGTPPSGGSSWSDVVEELPISITPLPTYNWEKYIQPIEVPSVSLGTNEVQSVVIVEDKTTTNNTPAKVELSAYDRSLLEKYIDAIENGQASTIMLDGRIFGQTVSTALKTELNYLGYTPYAL